MRQDKLLTKIRSQMSSSTQNLPDKDSDPQAEKSSQNETISENSKAENSTETAGSSSIIQNTHVTQSNLVSTKESNFDTSNEEGSTVNLEKDVTELVAEELTDSICDRRVIMTYAIQQDPRQPFLNHSSQSPATTSRLPVPPPYYSANIHNVNPQRPLAADTAARNQERQFELYLPRTTEFELISNLSINSVFWAQYPASIPPNIPPCLAHLVDAEVLFIIQRTNIMYLFTGLPDINMFLILNKNYEYLYYVYETTDFCSQSCCRDCRQFQLHVIDMYRNEVIYMNKLFGSACLFCCYPVMEIYAPPTVPVGAVKKVFNPCREEFAIVDPDGNRIFKILGSSIVKCCCCFLEFTFTIYAMDSQKTVVGYIKRNFSGLYRTLLDVDLYGVSFPKNLDARIKAVFLGALFLISLKRTGWVLRNVEDPETVSGHMYRMSIMTFLIPESSGVDKTRCMKLSLVHDLAECIVGDLTPYCGVNTSEKHRQEEVAMKELTQLIGDSGIEIYKLYKEYEAQVTKESKFVKDLDRLDMILQAFEYEKLGEKPGKLEEFFASTINKFHFPWTIDIVKEIYKQRNLHINKDKSLGKDL